MSLNKTRGFLGSLCVAVPLLGVTWSEPEPIGDRGYPLLFHDNHANCWCDADDSVHRYDYGSSGWIVETESRLPSHDWGSICFDKGDTLWVIWNWREVYYERYYEGSWFDEGEIHDYALPPGLALTADSTGRVWVFFDNDERCHVVCMRYKDGVWDTLSEHVCNPGGQLTLSATTDADGKVWFGWWYKWYSDSTSYLKTAYYDDGAWSDTMTIDSAISTGFYIPMAMDFAPDRNGGLWVVWEYAEEWGNPNVLHARYWDGDEWLMIDTVATDINDPRVAVDEYGNAWVVWEKDGDIWFAINSKGGWSQPARVTEHPSTDDSPDIEVDGHGRVWCAWRRDSAEVYVSYVDGLRIEENTDDLAVIIRVEASIGQHFTFHISSGVTSESLDIYDAGGRLVRSLLIECRTVTWEGRGSQGVVLPTGVYFARCGRRGSNVQKLVILR